MAALVRPHNQLAVDVQASLLTRKMRSLSTVDVQLPPTPVSPAPPRLQSCSAYPSPPPLRPQYVQRLPKTLPPCPPEVRKVRLDELDFANDEELRGVPDIFLRDMLAHLAPRLLAGCDAVEPLLPTSISPGGTPTLPSPLPCLLHPTSADAILPTHLLAITFPPTPPSPVAERLLVPIHALPWSLACAVLASVLSSSPTATSDALPPSSSTSLPFPASAPQGADHQLDLPVVALSLPDRPSFELLHAWVYGTSTKNTLWEALVYPSPDGSDSAADGSTDHDVGKEEGEEEEEEEDAGQRLGRIVALWKTAVALQVGDEELWEAMGKAWEVVVEEVLAARREGEGEEGEGSGSEGELEDEAGHYDEEEMEGMEGCEQVWSGPVSP